MTKMKNLLRIRECVSASSHSEAYTSCSNDVVTGAGTFKKGGGTRHEREKKK